MTIPSLLDLEQQMMEFATTRPSPQQTRQKSAREMVEHFASELAAVRRTLEARLEGLRVDWREASERCVPNNAYNNGREDALDRCTADLAACLVGAQEPR